MLGEGSVAPPVGWVVVGSVGVGSVVAGPVVVGAVAVGPVAGSEVGALVPLPDGAEVVGDAGVVLEDVGSDVLELLVEAGVGSVGEEDGILVPATVPLATSPTVVAPDPSKERPMPNSMPVTMTAAAANRVSASAATRVAPGRRRPARPASGGAAVPARASAGCWLRAPARVVLRNRVRVCRSEWV